MLFDALKKNKELIAIPLGDTIIMTANHGGYEEGMCVGCGRYGSLGHTMNPNIQINHEPGCVVGKRIQELDEGARHLADYVKSSFK